MCVFPLIDLCYGATGHSGCYPVVRTPKDGDNVGVSDAIDTGHTHGEE